MNKIYYLCLLFILQSGCDLSEVPATIERAENVVVPTIEVDVGSSPPASQKIVREINRLPLGDARLINTDLPMQWNDDDEDLFSDLIRLSKEVILFEENPIALPNLVVQARFLPKDEPALVEAYAEYAEKDQRYTSVKTIWRLEGLHIVLAGTETLMNDEVPVADRTDLLVLKDEKIIDGVTLYYKFRGSFWGAYQLFYIDENKQIWLQRFVYDEESLNTMQAKTLVVLPNGRIRTISTE